MSETKFTPGPWRASVSEPPGQYLIHAAFSPWVLTYVVEGNDGKFPMEANAALIAAAPDLYRELAALIPRFKAAVRYAGNDDETAEASVAMAVAALAKARGDQPQPPTHER